MLLGSGPRTEPGIVGDVDNPARLRVWNNFSGKQDFVADERTGLRRAGHIDRMRTISGGEVARHAHHLREAEAGEEILEGQVFAEGDEVELVIDALRLPAIGEEIEAVEVVPLAVRAGGRAQRAGHQNAPVAREARDLILRVR